MRQIIVSALCGCTLDMYEYYKVTELQKNDKNVVVLMNYNALKILNSFIIMFYNGSNDQAG